jgi:hypothetical protein
MLLARPHTEMNSTPPHRVGSRGVLSARSWSMHKAGGVWHVIMAYDLGNETNN